jgi:hypothetical protein
MKKITIFVEGWTEQAWVREYLLRWFDYQHVKRIYQLVGKNYDKHQGEIDAFISHLSKRDYELFLASDKCQSFNVFHNAIHA